MAPDKIIPRLFVWPVAGLEKITLCHIDALVTSLKPLT